MSAIPAHFHTQYSKEDIHQKVEQIGAQISDWAAQVWEESHTDILAIPVLRGGIFFFADLVRAINTSVEIVPAQTWAYEVGEIGVQRPDVKVNISSVPAKGREILLVDDICDSGRTLEALTKACKEAGALNVRSAVLIKRIMDQPTFDPEYVGFEFHGSEWFVGYGMEDNERWRNLADIYVIKQS